MKRQKNDMADAEAICEAAQRPTMRFVAVKSEAKQASAVIFRTRDLLVGQRTQIINALRGHMGEFGFIAPQGAANVDGLVAEIEDPSASIPEAARTCLLRLVEMLRDLQTQVEALDAEIAARAKRDEASRRLMTIPGIGPLIATALEALSPPAQTFRSGRDFAAWIGLTPVQKSTGAAHGPDVADGRTNAEALADYRLLGRSAMGQAQRRNAECVAVCNAGAEAGDAGHRRARQQDGADRLGGDDARRGLSGASRRIGGCAKDPPRRERVGGQQYGAIAVKQGQENQAHGQRFERAPMMWT